MRTTRRRAEDHLLFPCPFRLHGYFNAWSGAPERPEDVRSGNGMGRSRLTETWEPERRVGPSDVLACSWPKDVQTDAGHRSRKKRPVVLQKESLLVTTEQRRAVLG